ncbi:MAG: hypothetical protein CMF22_10455 [Idiomarinaceae bacterium]|nr:hypothetical protein [Idiomarinaceae bacterium]MBG23862.1 hypothetical protein [Idiomarinaceae bacterium]|tara:strand:- start:15566 stop:16006 length:441 start_codon:yes stop_codon:yes gene_type:complete
MITFSDDQLYDIDNELARYITAALKQFLAKMKDLNETCGIFTVPNDFYPANVFELTREEYEEVDKKAAKEWFKTIEKMIVGFDVDAAPDAADYDFGVDFGSRNDDGRFAVRNEEEFNRYKRDMTEYEYAAQDGRLLFAKYFTSLWI